MKVIFLDIDGVLNCQNYYVDEISMKERTKENYPYSEISKKRIELLNQIIEQTNSKIVVSSTWRLGRTKHELQNLLDKCGLKGEVIDKTPHLGGKDGYGIPRGCEIELWLKKNDFQRVNWSKEAQKEYLKKSKVKNYIILDDDSDMLYNQKEHFICTSGFDGLTQDHVDKAIEILNKDLIQLYYGEIDQKVSKEMHEYVHTQNV